MKSRHQDRMNVDAVFRTPSNKERTSSPRSSEAGFERIHQSRDPCANLVYEASDVEERERWEEEEDSVKAVTSSSLRSKRTSRRNFLTGGSEIASPLSIKAAPPAACVMTDKRIDPFRATTSQEDEMTDFSGEAGLRSSPSGSVMTLIGGERVKGDDIFLASSDMQRDDARLRVLAGQLSRDWRGSDFLAPALACRVRDFQFAQDRRRKKYGDERPWGILGLYDHLAAIRVDVEWAEDSAWRRANGEPYLSWADFEVSKKHGVNRPFFTYLLLLACSVAMIISIALNGWKVEPLSVNAMIGPSAQTLVKMGAKDSNLIVNDNEAWRLMSSVILHAGFIHYFINMMALWFVGNAIEVTHGSASSSVLFFVPAIGGTIISAIFLPQFITVGASGGIFGLVGACLADITMNWNLLFSEYVNENGKRHKHVMVIFLLVLDIALSSIIGLTPYVDNFTHLGGMSLGFLCGLSTITRLDFFGVEQSCCSQTKRILVRFFGLIVSVSGIIVGSVVLFEGNGQTTPCPSCIWITCVPFPPWNGPRDQWWYCDDCGQVVATIVDIPSLHLELVCPGGNVVPIALNITDGVDRNKLQNKLPTYCREYCPKTHARELL